MNNVIVHPVFGDDLYLHELKYTRINGPRKYTGQKGEKNALFILQLRINC